MKSNRYPAKASSIFVNISLLLDIWNINGIVRDAVVFNMDPANEKVPYEAAVDISELVNAQKVASELSLGPNGSLLYAMEFLERNMQWLDKKLVEHMNKYILFDFPGQIELYTHNECIRAVVQRLNRRGYRVSRT